MHTMHELEMAITKLEECFATLQPTALVEREGPYVLKVGKQISKGSVWAVFTAQPVTSDEEAHLSLARITKHPDGRVANFAPIEVTIDGTPVAIFWIVAPSLGLL